MDNLTISPVDNLRPRDNDINLSELGHGHPEALNVAINIEEHGHPPRSATTPAQVTTAPIQDMISSLGLPSEVWYFDEGTGNLCKEPKLPLKLTITERVTTRMWHTEDCQLKPGLYDIVFGISTQFFDASLVDSIVFYIDINQNVQSQIVEAIIGNDLREFLELSNAAGQVSQVCELKLHQQIGFDDQQIGDDGQQTEVDDQRQDGCKMNVKMEIRFRRDISPETIQRALSMHYFELYKCSETKVQGLPKHVNKTYVHKPYVWSIDVQHCENPYDTVRSLKISRYSISGDGTLVATLSATDNFLFLDLWDISTPKGSAPHSTKKLAEKQLLHHGSRTHTDPHASISVSWDAKYIALFPTTEGSWVEKLSVYNRTSIGELAELRPAFDPDSLEGLFEFKGEAKFHITNADNPEPRNELFITCDSNLVNIYKVHGPWSRIFSFPVQPSKFIHLESLTEMSEKHLRENFARKLINSLQGRFFMSFSVIDSVLRPLIWDIEKHSLLVAMLGSKYSSEYPMIATFSTDQSILAILQDGGIRTYWTGSKTPIGKWTVPDNIQVSRMTFVRNDTQLLVECTDSTKQERVGYILDPVKTQMTILDKDPIAKVLGPGEYMPEVQRGGRNKEVKNNTQPQRLYSCHNSKLDFIQLSNIIYEPGNLNTHECDQHICDESFPIPIARGAFKSESGLEFKYKFNTSGMPHEFEAPRDPDTSSSCLDDKSMFYKLSTLSLQISDRTQRKSLRIPTVTLTTESEVSTATPSAASKDPAVFFLRQKMLLILCSNVMITVWKLPEEYNDECTLLTARWIGDSFSSDITITTKSVDIRQCEYHQHLFICDREHVAYSLRVSLKGSYDSHENGFRLAVEGLAMMYIAADDKCKESIVQYLIENINRYQNSGGCVVLWITNKLSEIECHGLLEELLTSVLRSENSQWIPRPDFRWLNQHQLSLEFMHRLLRSSKHSPKRSPKYKELEFMELVKIITQYCFEIAREHKDNRLISPSTAFLPILWRHRYCEAALELHRKLAYIPMNHGTQLSRIAAPRINMRSILNNFTREVQEAISVIGDALKKTDKYIWRVRNVSDPVRAMLSILSTCVLLYLVPYIFWAFLLITLLEQGESHSIYDFQHPTVTDYLDISVKKYYVARFDMLWMCNELSSMSITGRVDQMIHDRLLAPLFVIWYSFIPSRRSIERHELNLDAFDNPAIEALIEYKWNAFGFYFWLIRFLFQCIYYILVLTVVFVQVYRGQDWIIPLYDTIIAFSATFLWFEFIQLIEERWKYITSPYNLFDLFVFVLPMIGCITAKRGEDITVFSFSVIFVFLHFLFELRTNKNVCYYSTIIIRIFGELKGFFFIFAGGIIAYAIAILHLLHGCITEDCATPGRNNTSNTSGPDFPYEPLSALSVTYFFIAGVYDPVSDKLANGDWRFRVMMAMFVLFTVIVMLNVLIALINTAFSYGDRTWRNVWLESRLGYIETVENMSYKIPGFRQRFHHWFFEEICYQASDDQVTAYKKKYLLRNELDEISPGVHDVRSLLKPTNTVNTYSNKEHQTQVSDMAVVHQQRVNTLDFGNENSSDTSSSDTQALSRQVQELQAQIAEIRCLLQEVILYKNG